MRRTLALENACRPHLANLTDRRCHLSQSRSLCPARKFLRSLRKSAPEGG